jgi:hypothetical protein
VEPDTEVASPTAAKLLFVAKTALTFEEAKRSEFWAGNFEVLLDSDFSAIKKLMWHEKCDAGITDFRGVVSTLKLAMSSCFVGGDDDSLNAAARAYDLIRTLVKNSTPRTFCCKRTTKNLLRWWGDVTVCHCARLSGVSDCTSFLRVLDGAFGGQLAGNLNLSSQMQQSYQKVFANVEGAFLSKSALLAQRRGCVRPRVARIRIPTEARETATATDDSAAAASAVSVDVAQYTGEVECSYEEGVCKLVHGSGERTNQGWHGNEGRQH